MRRIQRAMVHLSTTTRCRDIINFIVQTVQNFLGTSKLVLHDNSNDCTTSSILKLNTNVKILGQGSDKAGKNESPEYSPKSIVIDDDDDLDAAGGGAGYFDDDVPMYDTGV